jgi:hypothetical protein
MRRNSVDYPPEIRARKINELMVNILTTLRGALSCLLALFPETAILQLFPPAKLISQVRVGATRADAITLLVDNPRTTVFCARSWQLELSEMNSRCCSTSSSSVMSVLFHPARPEYARAALIAKFRPELGEIAERPARDIRFTTALCWKCKGKAPRSHKNTASGTTVAPAICGLIRICGGSH